MSFLIDTCVISELVRPKPEARVLEWFSEIPDDELVISTLTLGELWYGISLLKNGRKKNDLIKWYTRFSATFKDSTLPVTNAISVRWGTERARLRGMGIHLPVIDGLIAATAIEYGYTLVTRNTADYLAIGVLLFNPWD